MACESPKKEKDEMEVVVFCTPQRDFTGVILSGLTPSYKDRKWPVRAVRPLAMVEQELEFNFNFFFIFCHLLICEMFCKLLDLDTERHRCDWLFGLA